MRSVTDTMEPLRKCDISPADFDTSIDAEAALLDYYNEFVEELDKVEVDYLCHSSNYGELLD